MSCSVRSKRRVSVGRLEYLVCIALFLLLPPILLWCHIRFPKRFTWPVVILLDASFGWALINASLHLYQNELARVVRETPNPSAELLEAMQTDGAANVFTMALGWAYALAYLLVWVFPYLLVPRLLRLFARD